MLKDIITIVINLPPWPSKYFQPPSTALPLSTHFWRTPVLRHHPFCFDPAASTQTTCTTGRLR